MSFEELVAEAVRAPVEGWDFSYFDGRATEERPPWGYAVLLSERLGQVGSALDVETGGGEVFSWALAQVPSLPRRLAATEGFPPNAALARAHLGAFGVEVVEVTGDGAWPFEAGEFELVSSRHPVEVRWEEVGRVLRPGGRFFSQMVGAGTNRELYEYLMGPQPEDDSRSPQRAIESAAEVGLRLVELREQALEVAFFDIGAVVHFLRKVPWTVPDFSVDTYHDRLAALHGDIERDGRFVCHSQRYLIELEKTLPS